MSVSEKLTNISESFPEVYDLGKKSQSDEFWDSYQQNGTRTNYTYAFSGHGWNKNTYNPKYPFTPAGSGTVAYMFSNSNIEKIGDVDLTRVTGNVANVFRQNFLLTEIGEIVLNNAVTQVTNLFFSNSELTTIKKLKFGTLTNCSTAFAGTKKLTSIIIEGTLAGNIDFKDSTLLSKESLISIIDSLSTTTSGLTITFSTSAVNAAFGIDVNDETTFPEGSEYYILRNSKSNWNFSYA